MSEGNSDNGYSLLGGIILFPLAPASAFAGFLASMALTPFIADVGLLKGGFAHLLVTAGVGLGATGCSLGSLVAIMFGDAAANTVRRVVPSSPSGSLFRKDTDCAAYLKLAVITAGAIYGGVQGYNFTNEVVHRGLEVFRGAAAENPTRAALPTPFQLTTQDGRPVATFTPKAALG